MKANWLLWGLTLGMVALAAPARASSIIHMLDSSTGTSGGDPNQITDLSGGVSVYDTSAGHTINSPWSLIIVTPETAGSSDNAGFSNASITSITGTVGAASWSFLGEMADMTATSGDVYSLLGDGHGPNSDNWTNLYGFDSGLAPTGTRPVGTTFAPGTITGFDVYVFSITGQIADQSSANITFASGALPVGSYILATDGTNFVPFTEAGVIETSAGSGGGGLPAPEPATLGLVALAGVALLGSRTRRRS